MVYKFSTYYSVIYERHSLHQFTTANYKNRVRQDILRRFCNTWLSQPL